MKLAGLAFVVFISAVAAGPIEDVNSNVDQVATSAFSALDTNGDGKMDASEIVAAIGSLGVSVSSKQVTDFLKTNLGKEAITLADLDATRTAATQAAAGMLPAAQMQLANLLALANQQLAGLMQFAAANKDNAAALLASAPKLF